MIALYVLLLVSMAVGGGWRVGGVVCGGAGYWWARCPLEVQSGKKDLGAEL